MAKYYFTSDDLLESIKRRANIPDSQDMITEEEILAYANEEMQMEMVPMVISKHEDYYLVKEEILLISGQTEYQIPYRAIGSRLREVAWRDANLTSSYREMFRISPDDITNMSGFDSQRYFHLESDRIVISESSEFNDGFLVMWYWMRPNSLVDSSRVGIITEIDTVNGMITLSDVPDNFDIAELFDLIKTKSPHRILAIDLPITNVNTSTKTITFSDPEDIPSVLVVGDRIAMSGETDLINLPSDLHPMLAQMVAARILEELGDKDNLQYANEKLKKMEMRASSLIDNRVVGSPFKARNRNGFLKGSRRRRRGL